jgi:hypothetical protein
MKEGYEFARRKGRSNEEDKSFEDMRDKYEDEKPMWFHDNQSVCVLALTAHFTPLAELGGCQYLFSHAV